MTVDLDDISIAVIIPCHDEESAVGPVVRDFRRELPGATIFVYDNASTDRTAEVARAAGAVVRREPLKGKGNAVRRAFADVEADVYVLIDGDGTYDVSAAPRMIATLLEQAVDQVVGVRRPVLGSAAYRPGHVRGNRILNRLVEAVFGDSHDDMLSGYRVFSRRFVKSFPALSRGFEIETELTVHSLSLRIPTTTVEVGFCDRAAGSESKLRTYRDGFRILGTIGGLARQERPIATYGSVAAVSALPALALLAPVMSRYLAVGDVPRLPSLLVASLLAVVTVLFLATALGLDATRKARHEAGRLAYVRHSAVANVVARRQAAAVSTIRRLPSTALQPGRPAALGAVPGVGAVAADLAEGAA